MRSTRTSSATLTRASRMAKRQHQSLVSGRQNGTKPSSRHTKLVPAIKKTGNHNKPSRKDEKNVSESEEEDEEDVAPRRSTRITPVLPKRKSARAQKSPRSKKIKFDKEGSPSPSGELSRKVLRNNRDTKQEATCSKAAGRVKSSDAASSLKLKNWNSGDTSEHAESNGNDESSDDEPEIKSHSRSHSRLLACNGQGSANTAHTTNHLRVSNNIKSKREMPREREVDPQRESVNGGLSKHSDSDNEVILTGHTSVGSKIEAMKSLQVPDIFDCESSDSDIEEVCPSDQEDAADEQSDESTDDMDNEEVVDSASDVVIHTIEDSDSEAREGHAVPMDSAKHGSSISRKDMEKLLKEMRREYEDLVKTKDEVIERLRNELAFKEQQLEDLNNLATKNMELEARISEVLGNPEAYKKEVSLASKKLVNDATDKVKVVEAKKEETKAEICVENLKTATKKTAKAATKTKSEEKQDSDIEVLSSHSKDVEVIERRSTRKRSAIVEIPPSTKAPAAEKKPRRQRKTKNEESDDGEEIEALFVSDDEDTETKGDTTKGQDKKKPVEEKETKEKEKDDIEDKTDKKENEEEDDLDDTQGKGRHNIRKLFADKKLTEQTKAAAKEEKQRRDRVAKLKEKHQIVSHIDPKTKIPVCTKMTLAFKKDQKTPLIEVNSKLIRKLKPHQVEAVEFMWDSTIESLDQVKAGDAGYGCIIAHCMGLGKTLAGSDIFNYFLESVEFLWDSLIESVDQVKLKSVGAGCILAHCMGLGKTLSVITFVHTLLTHKVMKMKTCLVVCPLNTVLNWQYEWQKWLDKKDRLPVYEMASAKDNHQRASLLSKWHKEGGIMIMGYQIFRILAMSNTKSKKKKKIFDDTLISQGADIIVCDEGHVLKNDASAISKCTNMIRSKRRIILTGTPLQNNLLEYHCMVNFVKPNLLGTRKEFCNRFVNPITNGQHADSTQRDVKIMKRRAHVLHEMLAGCVQRRDYSSLVKFLPPKYEYVISVRLSPLQIKLYEKYLELHRKNAINPLRGASLFSDYQALMRIWTHPWVLKMDEIRQEKRKPFDESDDDELEELFASDTSEEESESVANTDENNEKGMSAQPKSTEKNVGESEEGSSEGVRPRRSKRHPPPEKDKASKDSKKGSKESSDMGVEDEKKDDLSRRAKLVAGEVIKQWQTNSRRKNEEEEDDIMARRRQEQWWWDLVKEEDHKTVMELSGKLILLFDILRMAEGLGDKVLLFSQSILSLDLIEDFLAYKNEEAEKLKETKKGKNVSLSFWKKDEDYFRMDGSTSAQNRKKFTTFFNCAKNKRIRLFLISTKAGGLGINLECANRVVIFDASWNPSHDVQSIFRAYRFGQEKDVFIYRLLAQGTMEEKIYERQVTKETLSQRVIDEHQLDRHFTASDLQELYVFKPDRLDDPDRKERATPKVPKDIILAELLSEQKDWIVGYHEHDSLLEKRPEEDLSEEERKAAWEEYDRDKQGIMYQYRPHVGSMAMYNYNYRPSFQPPAQQLPQAAPFLQNRMYQFMPRVPPVPRPIPSGSAMAQPSMAGTDPQYNKINFQLQQLPRVVQEILKYNPSISPVELQSRLRAFMGMHGKYGTVPGFALPNSETLVGEPRIGVPVSSTSQTSIPPYQPILPSWPTMPTPAALSQAISSEISSAATSVLPSRLPPPGPVPANFN